MFQLWVLRCMTDEPQAKHGSSTDSYAPNGVFDQRRFDYVFKLYTTAPHTHINLLQGVKMLYGNRDTFDFVSRWHRMIGKCGLTNNVQFGWTAASLEWLATYLMLWPPDGRLKREDILAIYDVRPLVCMILTRIHHFPRNRALCFLELRIRQVLILGSNGRTQTEERDRVNLQSDGQCNKDNIEVQLYLPPCPFPAKLLPTFDIKNWP